MELWMMWLGLAMILLVIELIKPKWIIFWFAIGALAGVFASLFLTPTNPLDSFGLQILIFFAVSLILLVLARPIAAAFFLPKHKTTNIRSAIGRIELCSEDIDNAQKKGAVELYGTSWNARSVNDDIKIKAGTKVEIVNLDGLNLIVKPTKQ